MKTILSVALISLIATTALADYRHDDRRDDRGNDRGQQGRPDDRHPQPPPPMPSHQHGFRVQQSVTNPHDYYPATYEVNAEVDSVGFSVPQANGQIVIQSIVLHTNQGDLDFDTFNPYGSKGRFSQGQSFSKPFRNVFVRSVTISTRGSGLVVVEGR